MRRIRYSKYVPDPAGEMSMEDLLSALSDYLLQSGFQNYMFYDLPEGDQNLDALRRAIEQALLDSDLFDEELRERLQQMQMEGQLEQLIEKLIERMEQEDFISIDDPPILPNLPPPEVKPGKASKQSSRSPTKVSTFWATKPCAIFWARWGNPALDATIPGTWPPASKPAAHRSSTNLATP